MGDNEKIIIMKKPKYQKFPEFVVDIKCIMSPNGKYVDIIPIEEFQQYECNPTKIDYCAISDDRKQIIISSKAKYKFVIVHDTRE